MVLFSAHVPSHAFINCAVGLLMGTVGCPGFTSVVVLSAAACWSPQPNLALYDLLFPLDEPSVM